MKETIENSIKKSLENHELPYNPDAWKSLSAKLDAQGAASGSSAGTSYKWYYAASAIVAVAVTSYFLFSTDQNGSTTPQVADNSPTTVVTDSNPSSPNSTSTQETTSSPSDNGSTNTSTTLEGNDNGTTTNTSTSSNGTVDNSNGTTHLIDSNTGKSAKQYSKYDNY